MDPRILGIPFLAGPTAVGKTGLALAIARPADALILSVDARQVYRGMDKGTGKPGEADVRAVHRLLDIWEPEDRGTAVRFAEEFHREVVSAWSAGRRVLATCGSGFYLDACLGRVDPMPRIDPAVRGKIRAEAERAGPRALRDRLRTVDPETAERLSERDTQRLLRALEVWESTGRPLSRWHKTGHGPLDVRDGPPIFLLARPREELNRRIAERCRAMLESGLEDEIRELLSEGLAASSPAFKTLGYAEWLAVVLGKMDRDEATDLFIRKTRQYARRQMTWFRNRYRGVRELSWPRGESAAGMARRILAALPEKWGLPESGPGSARRRMESENGP